VPHELFNVPPEAVSGEAAQRSSLLDESRPTEALRGDALANA